MTLKVFILLKARKNIFGVKGTKQL